MSSYERRQYFEALCQLKDGYASRSEDDCRSALSVDDAIIYADAVMAALEVEAEVETAVVADDATVATETSVSDPRD